MLKHFIIHSSFFPLDYTRNDNSISNWTRPFLTRTGMQQCQHWTWIEERKINKILLWLVYVSWDDKRILAVKWGFGSEFIDRIWRFLSRTDKKWKPKLVKSFDYVLATSFSINWFVWGSQIFELRNWTFHTNSNRSTFDMVYWLCYYIISSILS